MASVAAAAAEAARRTGATEATVALTLLATAGQDGGGRLVDRLDAQRHDAEHVLVQPELALGLLHRGRGRVDAEEHVMPLAVLLDAVGEAAQAPVFALLHLAALLGDDGGDQLGDRLDLLLRDVVACNEHAFI